MKLAILNTSILTNDGNYSMKAITTGEAITLVSGSEIDSAIGHESTAQILSVILGVEIPMNRQMFAQEVGQQALVFKLNGRPPEGKILSLDELKEIGFSFKLLIRTA
jgi:Domain of unknown function (DUF1874)